MGTVERAEEIAHYYHRGQVDKQGEPYIKHVFRVATSHLLTTDEQRQAAWLHDVLEDTDCRVGTLQDHGIPDDVVAAVILLTHKPGQSRRDYIDRILRNPIALAVKKADNRDNYARNKDLPAGELRDRLRAKYEREWEWLTEEA